MTTSEFMQDGASAVAAMAGRTPDSVDLSGVTPCEDWDLETLVNHVLGTTQAMARLGRREPLDPDDPWGSTTKAAVGDWRPALAERVRAVAAGWSEPAAWEGTLDLGGGEQPAADLGDMAFVEIMLHGWDIARATGQHLDVPDAVAGDLLRAVAATAELGRKMHAYDDEIEVAEDAGDFDRALGMAGRDPAWGEAEW
jgi:uncharacterized protein (TIGR03086 family)